VDHILENPIIRHLYIYEILFLGGRRHHPSIGGTENLFYY